MVNKTAGTHEEAVELVLGVELLDSVEDTADDIVAARSLAARKDYTYIDFLAHCLIAGNKLHEGHAISVGEQFLDFFLIAYALGRLAFLYLNGTLKTFWQFRLVSSAFSLQKTFFHFTFIC